MPQLEFWSVSFSTFLIVSITGLQLGLLDTFYTCRVMACGGLVYFVVDSILDVFVLDQFNYLLHHVVALGAFYFIGNAEALGYSVAYMQTGSLILLWLEVSTVLLNIRSLLRRSIKKKTLSECTFSEGSIDASRDDSFNRTGGNGGGDDNTAKSLNVTSMDLRTELFFIASYGGIRGIICPYLLLTQVPTDDPMYHQILKVAT